MEKKSYYLSRKSLLFLVLCLIIFLTSTSVFATNLPSVDPMSESLSVELSKMGASDIIDVIIWTESPNLEDIEKQSKNNIGITSDEITDDLGIELIQKFILEKRLLAREAYRTQNSKIEAQGLSKNNQVLFKSEFSPMLIMRLDKSSVLLLSKNSSVQKMTIFENKNLVPSSNIANENTGITNIRDTQSINATGKNVNIGQIEPAILTPNLSVDNMNYFNQQKLNHVNTLNSTPSTAAIDIRHANLVAAIMVGQPILWGTPYKGGAPDANLFYGSVTNELTFYEVIEAMITQGVNVINMSAEWPYVKMTSYENDFKSRWIDHIAFVHDVHFVNVVGNQYWTDGVSSPGLAYNAIVIGSLRDNNQLVGAFAPSTLATQNLNNNFSVSDFSSSIFNYNQTVIKPDLIAYGEDIGYGNIYLLNNSIEYNDGTSFAAPQVTAAIAQLCEKYPSLLTQQVGMKALLSTTAVFRPNGTFSIDPNSEFRSRMGSGILGARTAYVTRGAGKFWEGTMTTSTKSININVPSSYSYLRVGLSWIKKNSITGSHTDSPVVNNVPLADLKLELFYNGQLVASSDTAATNAELIQIPITQYGTYTIKITNKNYGGGSEYTNQYIAVVWY